MKTLLKYYIIISFAALFSACNTRPSVPLNSIEKDVLPNIYPDYVDVTVPTNIAPLNFMMSDTSYVEVVADVKSADGTEHTFGQKNKVIISAKEWTDILSASAGKSIDIKLYGKAKASDEWHAFRPFKINVAPETIDDYISYRLIAPGYVIYNDMSIEQRELSSFEESEIFNNKVTGNNREGQCVNCHSYQNYSTDNMLFHVRVTHGGTVIVVDGEPRKVDLKRPYTISAGVYPSWHPSDKLIAFSTDQTHQYFHTSDKNKIEVFDDASDLILYDIEKDSVIIIAADPKRMEVFPTWTPDGQYLYYCSADPVNTDSVGDYRINYEQLKYNLYRRSFDRNTLTFGDEESVYLADTLNHSVSLPRVSPDGKYIAFAEGDYGYFNIWHYEADVKIMEIDADLDENRFLDTSRLNSAEYADSYPSWSSNGHWIMCASRRDDGNYSRVFISYFDGKTVHKAFELPQRDPQYNKLLLKSYNRPEFMRERVKVSLKEFEQVLIK